MKKSASNMTLLIEVVGCAVLVILMSWSSWSTVPSTVAIATDKYAVYLRELFVFRFSTHSVFLIGNLIIIVVVVQSTKLTEKTTPPQKVQFAPHQYGPQYSIVDQKINSGIADEKMKSRTPQTVRDFPDPQFTNNSLIKEVRSVTDHSIVPTEVCEKASVKPESSQLYKRTMSARYERGGTKVKRTVSSIRPELMRSKTGTWEGPMGVAGRFDELNHDEFRRKIESFIDKQRKLIREELVVAGSDGYGFSFPKQ